MTDSDCRALYRWRHEGCAVSIWTADAFLTRYGMHLEEFMLHCQSGDLAIWASGHEPEWLRLDLSSEDLQSSDSHWRAEARAEEAS